jgi:molybdenum cofactor synthesis domain-containing protein
MQVGIITVSDRASQGAYADRSGPLLARNVQDLGWQVGPTALVADDRQQIQQALQAQLALGCDLILATGGTGIGPRDVTPEAVREMASREIPGLGELMRLESAKTNKRAALSRCLAAVIGGSLVICLPGKPSAAVECLGHIAEVIPHALVVLREASPEC